MTNELCNTPKERAKFLNTYPDIFINNQTAFDKGWATEETPIITFCEFCQSPLLTWGILGLQGFGYQQLGALWKCEPERCDCNEATAFWMQHDLTSENERKEIMKRRAAQNNRRQLDLLMSQAGLVDRYAGRTLSGFITEGADQSIIVASEKAYNFVEHFDKAFATGKGLYLTGSFGTGKTHLAAGIALEICKKMKPVVMLSMVELLARLRSSYSPDDTNSEMSLMNVFTQVDLLVIDDLGKESPSEWTLEKLYQIINARYELKKPIIVTTNYKDQELIARLAKPDGYGGYRLDQKTAGAIISRLHEMCSLVVMNGCDRRGKAI